MEQSVSFTPWRRIPRHELRGDASAAPSTLSLAEGLESPCLSCGTAPCCTHLPVSTFRVTTVSELSYADYLLNFDRIRLGLTADGDWSVYYVQPCRFLERSAFRCTVHGTGTQPRICQNYNPFTCWYRPRLTASVGPDFLQIDRARFAEIAARARTNEARDTVELPSFDELAAVLAGVRDEDRWEASEPPIADQAFEGWEALVLGRIPTNGAAANGDLPPVHGIDYRADPCDGCGAPCCQTITFPQGLPTTRSGIDYFRFCLGFPGVELLVTDTGWSLVIKATCRHLVAGRCGIYARPERPLMCRYYDAWKCTYRVEFGRARPAGSMRVRLEQLDAVAECLTVNGDGDIVGILPVEVMRSHVERRWRERAAAAVAP